jgi:hypothetical protein
VTQYVSSPGVPADMLADVPHPKCMPYRKRGEAYTVPELEGGVKCYRSDGERVRARRDTLVQAVREREAIAAELIASNKTQGD